MLSVKISKQEMLALDEYIFNPAELTQYAAAAAAEELASNWTDSFRDGCGAEIVDNDIEEVCGYVRAFGEAVKKELKHRAKAKD